MRDQNIPHPSQQRLPGSRSRFVGKSKPMNKPPQQMNLLCNVVIRAPGGRTPDVQEHHIAIYHTLCAMLEEEFFG
jgi:hypothetical protein